MQLPTIIGIRGKMGCGKDSFALFLNQYQKDYEIVRFSKGLREAACILTSMKIENTWSDFDKAQELNLQFIQKDFVEIVAKMVLFILPEYKIEDKVKLAKQCMMALCGKEIDNFICIQLTFGELLQLLGTEFFRFLDEDCFVKYLYRTWNKKTKLIITDVRFKNEVNFVHANNGTIVFINRPLAERKDGRNTKHESETALNDIKSDFIIENDLDLFEFDKKAKKFLQDNFIL